MEIIFRTVSRNSSDSGEVAADSRRIFNFDALLQEHGKEEREFLTSLTSVWQEVPGDLLDPTTRSNFRCFAKLPAGD